MVPVSQKSIKLANPRDGFTHVSEKRAHEYVRNDRAHFDTLGRLVFNYGAALDGGVLVVHGRPDFRLLVKAFSGPDAMPDSPVMPHWPTTDEMRERRQRGYR